MKKLVLALTAVAAFSAPALAADMAAKAPVRAAPIAYAPSWTGCYIGGGGGFGMWNQENTLFDDTTIPRTQLSAGTTGGGRGYFGTVGGGCDYQFGLGTWNVVVGAFGDYDFASMKGHPNFTGGTYGQEKLSSQWSVGGRIGALITPNLLTYFSAGYTEAEFDQVNLLNSFGAIGTPAGLYFGSRSYSGYFLSAGDEYALNFLPGLFWKTEYRFSDLDTKNNPIRFTAGNALTGASIDSHKYVHTIRSELVYRFNWGGPVVAKY